MLMFNTTIRSHRQVWIPNDLNHARRNLSGESRVLENVLTAATGRRVLISTVSSASSGRPASRTMIFRASPINSNMLAAGTRIQFTSTFFSIAVRKEKRFFVSGGSAGGAPQRNRFEGFSIFLRPPSRDTVGIDYQTRHDNMRRTVRLSFCSYHVELALQ